jgi:hypothetical protein
MLRGREAGLFFSAFGFEGIVSRQQSQPLETGAAGSASRREIDVLGGETPLTREVLA